MKKLPRGYFEFSDSKENVIKGRLGTWALNRFCEKMKVATLSELYQAITGGISIHALAEIILCAVEYEHRGKECPYTVEDSLDWIDDLGGIPATVKFISSTMSVEDEGGEKKSDQQNP